MISMLAAAGRRAENTSTLYIIRMSRKAFFPLGGYFVENNFKLLVDSCMRRGLGRWLGQ
jgi:hypothetical protein